MKFKSDVDGYVSGVRFYKASNNTGAHVGSLWTRTGTLLGQATFVNESASGWQTVYFPSLVPISAGVVYVVSYHTNTGHYYRQDGYFATAGVDSGPLHALQDGVSGSNGVYKYGANPAFPASGANARNYWVDVMVVNPRIHPTK